jgi:hypothetical protein
MAQPTDELAALIAAALLAQPAHEPNSSEAELGWKRLLTQLRAAAR